jgi:hypothetical protein
MPLADLPRAAGCGCQHTKELTKDAPIAATVTSCTCNLHKPTTILALMPPNLLDLIIDNIDKRKLTALIFRRITL